MPKMTSPLPDLSAFLAHLGTAVALGAGIGMERQWHQGMAGLRTNSLVATGAAAFVSLPGILGEDGTGPAHMATFLITGIGFLGAGVIMREGANVRGLNTAATLWVTASVGAFAGSGKPDYALAVAVAIVAINLLMRPLVVLVNRFSGQFGSGTPTSYDISVVCDMPDQKALRARLVSELGKARLSLRGLETRDCDGAPNRVMLMANVATHGGGEARIEHVVSHIAADPLVASARWARADAAENDPKLHLGS
jgi:putative Mg2+ transporter-C (MgtC) family protein